MRELDPQFEQAGVAVRFIVMGTPEIAERFCSRFGDASRCLADPEKRTYEAMGLERYNFLRLPFDRALRRRHKEASAAGFHVNLRASRLENAAQLPGAAFFDRDGIVRWLHRGTHPGDLPAMATMLESIRPYVQS